jgi:hypothetical protein
MAVVASAVLMTASMAGPVFAHPDDMAAGHLPAVQENVTLLGHANIIGGGAGQVADVSAFGNYAYLTVRDPEGCSDAGVAIFDISDPQNPRQVGFIEATEGSFPGEGSQVVDLKTSSFTGQVLVFNNEICELGGEGGVSLWDVTDPANPTVLTAHAGDPDGIISEFNEIHSAFAWQDKGRAFVVVVDNYEGGESDIDILEITDPRNPILISELGLNALGVEQDVIHGSAESFLHDMVVQKVQGRMVMLVSYWDGGWAQIDVSDPANPTLISHSDFPNPDPLTGITPTEGNAHQAEFSPNGELIIGTSEDFAPYRLVATITSGPFSGTTFLAQPPVADIPQVEPGSPLSGPVRYVGQACTPTSVPQAQPGEIALIERGGCTFQIKTDNINAAGYDGVVEHDAWSTWPSTPATSRCCSSPAPPATSCWASPATTRRSAKPALTRRCPPWAPQPPGSTSGPICSTAGATSTCWMPRRCGSWTPTPSTRRSTRITPPASVTCRCTRWPSTRGARTSPTCPTTPAACG